MQAVTIYINKNNITSLMEALVYKYANMVDNESNPKAVRNIKADIAADTVDQLIAGGYWTRRVNEVIHIMKDFVNSVTDSDEVAISLSMTNQWNGNTNALQSLACQYVIDGLMADWLTVTAPAEVPMYANKLPQDEDNIRAEIYSKGEPS